MPLLDLLLKRQGDFKPRKLLVFFRNLDPHKSRLNRKMVGSENVGLSQEFTLFKR